MFARHLMGVARRKAEALYAYGNPGAYATARKPLQIVYDDKGRIVFASLAGLSDDQRGHGPVSAAGEVPVVSTDKIRFFSTDHHGTVSELRSQARPGTSLSRTWVAAGLAVTETFQALDVNQATVAVKDLATGSEWQDPTAYSYMTPLVGRDGVWCIPDGRNTASGTAGSNGVYTYLAAGNGRAARCKLAREDQSGKALLYRWTMGARVPVTISPWRRPLTTDTYARLYGWIATAPGCFIRGGVLYRRVTFIISEVELSPSQGIVVKDGKHFTRHTYARHSTTAYGVLRVTADGATLVPTGRLLQTRQFSALQYLGDGDAPTGEYISEVTGAWDNRTESNASFLISSITTGTQRVPAVVTADKIMVVNDARDRLVIYDLQGTYVRDSAPPGGTIAAEWVPANSQNGRTILDGSSAPSSDISGAYFHVASHDLIVKASYDTVVPCSFNGGVTWVQTYIPSDPSKPAPPGYTQPPVDEEYQAGNIPAPVKPPADTSGTYLLGHISTWSPLFPT